MKKLILSAIIAGAALIGGTPEVQARECVYQAGYDICFDLKAQNGNYNRWNVVFRNSYTTEYMDVTCYGKSVSTWQSNGGLSQSEADQLAEYFCAI